MQLVPVDEDLVERLRAELVDEQGYAEKAMFGGVAFLLHGKMAIAASGQGGLLVRAGTQSTSLLRERGVKPMEMRGRPMTGWLRVDYDEVQTIAALRRWIAIGTAAAASLPDKAGRKSASRSRQSSGGRS